MLRLANKNASARKQGHFQLILIDNKGIFVVISPNGEPLPLGLDFIAHMLRMVLSIKAGHITASSKAQQANSYLMAFIAEEELSLEAHAI